MTKITLLLIVSLSFAAIEFSGDARFRPRLDVKEYGVASSKDHTSDLYYLYRARLNLKADVSENWFFNAQIGTPTKSGMTKMGSDPDVFYNLP